VPVQLEACLLQWSILIAGLSCCLCGEDPVVSRVLNNPREDAHWMIQRQTHIVCSGSASWGDCLGSGMLHTYETHVRYHIDGTQTTKARYIPGVW
jgi:hypothetical protein